MTRMPKLSRTGQVFEVSGSNRVPVLASAQVVIAGASLAACVTAWMLARRGSITLLAAGSTSLADDLVVARRSWARPREWHSLPDPFRRVFDLSVAELLPSGVAVLNLARLANGLEDLLIDAGVRFYYGLTPCGVESAPDGSLQGVLFGGKCGVVLMRADAVVDAGPLAPVARLAGAQITSRIKEGDLMAAGLAAKVKVAERPGSLVIPRGQKGGSRWRAVGEFALPVPGVPELPSGHITLHGAGAQLNLRLPAPDPDDPFFLPKLSVLARRALVKVGEKLTDERVRNNQNAVYFHRFSGILALQPVLRVSGDPGRVSSVLGISNLRICSSAADGDVPTAGRLSDPFGGLALSEAIAEELSYPGPRPAVPARLIASRQGGRRSQRSLGSIRFSDADPLHCQEFARLPARVPLRMLRECDVLVVGGGTSGVPAALAAAAAGARTILLEHHSDVGGVRTIGGVGSYWFGRATQFQKSCDASYDKVIAATGLDEEAAMMQCLLDAGVEVLAPCPVAGVVRRGRRVSGVIVAVAGGLTVVSGAVVVDATGDADLAAWAGAPFEYGNGRDAFTLWASFGNFNTDTRPVNRHYESAIEIRDALDLTRTIVRGRRRPGLYRYRVHEAPQLYVTPRESRRISGDVAVTYGGILAGETFPDTMVVCDSNFDIKGLASSDILACGAVWSWSAYRRYLAPVPYRAIIPRGLDNLLVAGRAYSASHDAISLARMQRDMVSLGGAAGVAAARAAAQSLPPAQLDITALQDDWTSLGMLRGTDRENFASSPHPYRRADAEKDCRSLLACRTGAPARMARLMRGGAKWLPVVRKAFRTAKSESARLKLARVVAFLGDEASVPFLIESIEKQIRNGLPGLPVDCLAVPPEHGWAPEPVYSLRAIARTAAAEKALPVMISIASRIEDCSEAFAMKSRSPFDYVAAICAVAERHPSLEMLRPLEILHLRHCLRGLSLPASRDLRFSEDPILERRSYLELCIGRAMARCGDRRGFEILEQYADDMRGPLARSARDELTELLGKSWLSDSRRRRGLLASRRRGPKPEMQPWRKMIP